MEENYRRHPSLWSSCQLPPPLTPKEKMGPNERCWCNSGKKWKKCHKDRDKQVPEHIGVHTANMRRELISARFCLHPEASPSNCGDRIIRAHTVQRKGGLAAITENGHVISAKAGFQDIFKNSGEIIPREHSARDASTFMGFCDRHDDEMFKPVEVGSPILNKENIFLLAFRAMAYELYQKKAALRCISIQRDLDKGKAFENQVYIQQYINDHASGLQKGLDSLYEWKASYDEAFLLKDYQRFDFYGVAFSEPLPVVGCGAFMPEFDFHGHPLQKISHGSDPFELLTFNLTVLNGTSVAIFGWTHGKKGPAARFVDSYTKLPDAVKANAAIQLAFEHIENVYMMPSWWDKLPQEVRDKVVHRLRSGIGLFGTERTGESLSNIEFNHVTSNVVEEFIEEP